MLNFEDDWNEHWGKYAESAAINPAQKYRRDLIYSLLNLSRNPHGCRLLDIGSGQGDLIASLHQRFPEVQLLGVELSRSGVEIATGKVSAATFIERDLLRPAPVSAEHAHWATHAVCSEVLEHLDSPRTLLENARAYMTAGCRLVVTVPGGPRSAFDKHIGHRRHFTPDDLRKLLADAGYIVDAAYGTGFPFFNLYRCVVILRGKRLIEDVTGEADRPSSPVARAIMLAFDILFRLNLRSLRCGWQVVGVARNPPA